MVPDALRLLDPAQTEGPIANDEASYFLQTRTGDGHPSSGDSSGSVGAVKYVALGVTPWVDQARDVTRVAQGEGTVTAQ